MDKTEILKILRIIFDEISLEYKVKRIGLFGSFVKNVESEESDIDILVELSEPISLFRIANLKDLLTQKFGRKVDLVLKGGLKPLIKERILEEVVYV